MDHVGITVPDINQAIEWFEDMMGAAAPLTFGPFSDPVGTFMHDLLDVDPKARDLADHDAAHRSQREHRALPVLGAGPAAHVPAQLGLERATTSRST